MSSPSRSPSETRSQDSPHGSSQYGVAAALEDTASSVNIGRRLPSPSRTGGQTSPNTAFAFRTAAGRSRSASPRPRRSLSPLGVSVAQRRAQLAAQSAATAVSGVGRVAEETRYVRELVEATSAEAKSVRSDVERRVAILAAASEENAARVAAEVESKMAKVAEYSDARASHVAADVTARLEKDIQVAASSATATAEITARTAVEGARRDIQAQLDVYRADALRKSDETQAQVQEISAQLAKLTEQLNVFKPASAETVGKEYSKVASDVQHKFDAQQQEIKNLSTVVLETQKAMQTNAETLHSLLTGMENLGENMRSMQEEMYSWQQEYNEGERQFQEMQDQLLQEVPLAATEKVQTEGTTPPVVPTPVNTSPKLPTIVEEPTVHVENPSEVPLAHKDEKSPEERWRKLVNEEVGPSVTGNNLFGPARGQSTIPQFFNASGSREQGSVPLPDRWPIPRAEIKANTPQRRINPIAVTPQGVVHETNVKQGTDTEVIDLRTETSSTSQSRSQPTVGDTTIMTEEARRIKEIVQDTIREQFAPGRAALRSNLGLPAQELTTTRGRANEENLLDIGPIPVAGSSQKNVSSTAPVGNSVPRSSFGSPVPIQPVSPSVLPSASGSHGFATAAWKPKEPPCFFGRNTEDAHTWVSLVRNYLTFMSGSDAQQVAYTVTLFRDSAHEWYMAHERRNRGPPRDWASLVTALLDRFGSNIRAQEAQSQLMSISQGNRPVRDYASQFETLLGRLESYDEGLMLNQFVWGLQPDLARSVSLHYPNSISKAVSLAETTELAVKASRRPSWNRSTTGSQAKGPNPSNRGQGRWKNRGGNRGAGGGYRGGSSVGSARGNTRGRGGRGRSQSVNYDPLACFQCGVRGHLARDCPQRREQSQGSGNAGPSRGTFSQSGHKGPRGRGRGRQVRFGGLNVLYDEDGNSYPVDDAGQLYVPLDFGQTADDPAATEEEKSKNIKN